jgi:hypothetical protein
LLVSDGNKLWSYDPDLNQVAVKKLGAAFGASPAALLAGQDLDKHFELKEGARRWRRLRRGPAQGRRRQLRAGQHRLCRQPAGEHGNPRQLRPDHASALHPVRVQSGVAGKPVPLRRPRPEPMLSATDLFSAPPSACALAEQMRPRTLDEVIGQTHLLGAGKPLRLAFASGTPHSMILWGPPGVGKTTLARLMADAFDAEFVALSAVFSGVKDIREAMQQAEVMAQQGRRTILFVDEVHRFNKAQQDAFLPYVENGTVTFIGATTENPSFEVNSALLSRAAVYVLKSFDEPNLANCSIVRCPRRWPSWNSTPRHASA